MMPHSTTDRVTPSDTFNPFLPAIGRVYQVLCQMAPAGGLISTSNRALAQAAQCSASAIPKILRNLEDLGYIARETSTRGSVLQVLDRSGMGDRPPADLRSDQHVDRRLTQPISDQWQGTSDRSSNGDRSNRPANQRSPMGDPPPYPPYMVHDSQAATAAAAQEKTSMGGDGGEAISMADRWPDRIDVALRLEQLSCDDDSTLLDAILTARPELTLELLDAQWEIAQQREQDGTAKNARALLFGTLRKPGQWLHGRANGSVDWSAYQRTQAAELGAPAPLALAPPTDFAGAQAQALRLVPDATPDERDVIAADLCDGRSEAQVREWLREHRARQAYLASQPRRREVAYAA